MIDICRSYHRVRRAFLADYGVQTIQFLLTRHRLACLLLLHLLLLAVQLDDPATHVKIIHYKLNYEQRNISMHSSRKIVLHLEIYYFVTNVYCANLNDKSMLHDKNSYKIYLIYLKKHDRKRDNNSNKI